MAISGLRQFLAVLSAALVLTPEPSWAFDGDLNFVTTIQESTCAVSVVLDSVNETAMLRLEPIGAPEGTAFIDGQISTVSSPITSFDLAFTCALYQATNIVQNGADGTFDTDGYMGITFRAQDQTGRFYDYEIALVGATRTQFRNRRDRVNFPPSALAGPDQTVASGAAVTLDGTGSSDPENLPLSYAWVQTGGPQVTLSDATAASPGFTAPSLPWNAPSEVISFSLVVNDGAQNSPADSVSITVQAPVDVTAPGVTLAGLPTSLGAGEAATVTVTFTEDVTGLDLADFQVTGANLSRLAGSGSTYAVTLTASGAGDVALVLPAAVVVDQAANGNLASNRLEAASTVVADTQAEITAFLQSRANSLVAAQPGLIPLLNREAGPQVTVTRGTLALRLTAGQNVWTAVTGQWGESGEAERSYLLAALGAHLWLSERMILGLMVEVDRAVEETADQRIEGKGWLGGPYVAGQVADQPLFYEARLLWGRTDNDLSRTGLADDAFVTTRLLAQARVEGELRFGALTLRPSLDASHVRDRADAYVDTLGNLITGQEVRQTQAALGLDLAREFTLGNGLLTPELGLSAIYSDTRGTGAAAGVIPAHDGWRGRIEMGLTLEQAQSLIEASAFYDGLGVSDYSDYGLSLQLSARF